MLRYKRASLLLVTALLFYCTAALGQTPEELIAIRGEFAQAIDDHDIDAILSHFAEDGIHDIVFFPAPLVTPEQIRAMWEDQFAGSPDWHTEDGRVLAAGNTVIVEHAAVGTNTAASTTLPATGNAWTWPHLDFYDFEGTKIKRLTSYGDYASVLIQLGLAPAPEMPPLVPSFAVPDPEPTGLSPLEANGELLARWNAHDVAGMAKMFHSDIVAFDAGLGMPVGREEYVAALEMMLQGSSDTTGEFTRAIDLGDGWVAVEVVFTGTHTGPFMGVPATGRTMTVRAGGLRRFDADGLVTNFALYYDNLTIMAQITGEEYQIAGSYMGTNSVGERLLVTITPLASDNSRFAIVTNLIQPNPPTPNRNVARGEVVKTGFNMYGATQVAYGTDEALQITATYVVSGPINQTGADTLEATWALAVHGPDGDPFAPDAVPLMCFPGVEASYRRIPVVKPCAPTPPIE